MQLGLSTCQVLSELLPASSPESNYEINGCWGKKTTRRFARCPARLHATGHASKSRQSLGSSSRAWQGCAFCRSGVLKTWIPKYSSTSIVVQSKLELSGTTRLGPLPLVMVLVVVAAGLWVAASAARHLAEGTDSIRLSLCLCADTLPTDGSDECSGPLSFVVAPVCSAASAAVTIHSVTTTSTALRSRTKRCRMTPLRLWLNYHVRSERVVCNCGWGRIPAGEAIRSEPHCMVGWLVAYHALARVMVQL
jgi:hypothetical protein